MRCLYRHWVVGWLQQGVSPRLSCDGSVADLDVDEVAALKASHIRREEQRQDQHTRGAFEFSAIKEKFADVKKGLLHRREPTAGEQEQLLQQQDAESDRQARRAEAAEASASSRAQGRAAAESINAKPSSPPSPPTRSAKESNPH